MLFILNKSHEVVGSLNSNGDLSRITTYFDDSYVQDLGTGAETFTFSTLADTEQSQHLVAGNFIAFKEDGEFKLFNIIQIEETHEDTFIKTVYCEMAGIELINEIIRPMKVLNSSLRKFLTTILEGTEWQLGRLDAGFTQVHDFEITDHKSVYELIQEHAVGTFGAEISYRVEIEHGRIVGKYIDCYKERGNSNGFRFAYGSNLTSVTRTVDMSNLATALIGVGKSGLTFKSVETGDKPLNQDFIVNETAFKQWNINGSHIFGVHKEETDSPQELLRLTRLALEERANPQIKYEMKVELLGREVKIGDTVNIVDHEFNPPLYLSARVNQLTRSKTDPYNDEVVLANFKEVRSNITDEMRNLASQLEGYVDSQFPIGGDKIQNGAIGKEQFSKQYHTEIVSDAVYASLVETEDLIAGKADIGDLQAVNATIENLKAENVEITGKLTATDAEIENLKAENVEINGSLTAQSASIKDLYANKISVSELNAVNAKVESLQATKADIDELNATKAEIEELIVKKADIESLTALYGKIEVLESSKANISDLKATNAQIDSLKANKADIIELDAVKGNITQLESEVAKIGVLESEVADIDELLAGNLTAENIATGAITAGSGIIANGAIGNAQISSLDASKISAGTVDTSKVTIQGADGHLRLKGNRLQVFQGVGNQAVERVSLGDVNADGSVYGLRVRGVDGQTVLLDENGVKSEGITNGAITNDKISEDANIDGAKLNINSVVTKINEDGTETIQGTKIEVDGTTLNTKLSTITTKQTEDSERISQAQSQITANTNAINLKVDEQTYTADKKDMTSKLEKNTSEITAMKGQIALKVEQSDIENAMSEVEGVMDSKIDTAKAEIKVTTDAITQNVTNLSQTVSTKADGSTVTAINNKVGSLETSVNGISGKVSSLEKTTTTLGENVEGVKGEVSTLKSDVASLEVTTSGISQKVESVESTTETLTTQVGTANTNATNALNKANSANTLADSKAKVFTSQPTVPYKVGDLWVQGTTGDVMKCKTARTTGSYTASDWEKASKYTDDTKANAVDGKVTTLEGTVSATTSKVAEITTNLEGITQRVSSTETTTTALTKKVDTVEGTANTAKNTADSASTNATDALNKANSANSKIDNLEIGTVNRALGTSTEKSVPLINQANQGIAFYQLKSDISDENLTVKFDYEFTNLVVPDNGTLRLQPYYKKSDDTSAWQPSIDCFKGKLVNGNSKGTVEFNMVVPDVKPDTLVDFRFRNDYISGELKISKLMVVKGNKEVKDWSPAPEDINSAINEVTAEITKTNQMVSSIETNLGSITSRVESVESTTSTINGKVTSLETWKKSAEQKITDDAIISTVTGTIDKKVNDGINNIQIGVNNLQNNSDFKADLSDWVVSTGYERNEDVLIDGINTVKFSRTGLTENSVAYLYSGQNKIPAKEKETFTASASFYCDTVNTDAPVTLGIWYYDESGATLSNTKTTVTLTAGKWVRVTDTSTAPAKTTSVAIVVTANRNGTFYVGKPKLEKGSKASDWSLSFKDLEKRLEKAEDDLTQNITDSIGSATKDILDDVAENYTDKKQFETLSETVESKFEQTSSDITASFTSSKEYTDVVDGKLQKFQETVGTHIRFSEEGIDLGKTNSPFTATLDNTKLAFKQDDEEVAYISNNKMHITHAEIKDTLRIGKENSSSTAKDGGFFTWVQGSKGNLSLKWSEN